MQGSPGVVAYTLHRALSRTSPSNERTRITWQFLRSYEVARATLSMCVRGKRYEQSRLVGLLPCRGACAIPVVRPTRIALPTVLRSAYPLFCYATRIQPQAAQCKYPKTPHFLRENHDPCAPAAGITPSPAPPPESTKSQKSLIRQGKFRTPRNPLFGKGNSEHSRRIRSFRTHMNLTAGTRYWCRLTGATCPP